MLNAARRANPATLSPTPPPSGATLSFDDEGVYITHAEGGRLNYFAAIRHCHGAYTVRILDGDAVRENRYDAALPDFKGIYTVLLATVPGLVGIGLS